MNYNPCPQCGNTEAGTEETSDIAEKTNQLQKHIQQLKNDGFKVIADCESLSIAIASITEVRDNQMREEGAKAERERLLKELSDWLEPQGLPLLKQRMYRKLLSLRSKETTSCSRT